MATAEEFCRARGLRLTALRRQVLELIWAQHQPAKAYDLLARLAEIQARPTAPPTVYRALEFLLEAGLVHRIESANAYVGCRDPEHRHSAQFLICRACGQVGELEESGIGKDIDEQAAGHGFRVERYQLEVVGLCPHCAGPDSPAPAQG